LQAFNDVTKCFGLQIGEKPLFLAAGCRDAVFLDSSVGATLLSWSVVEEVKEKMARLSVPRNASVLPVRIHKGGVQSEVGGVLESGV
jgi:hypothetical protein